MSHSHRSAAPCKGQTSKVEEEKQSSAATVDKIHVRRGALVCCRFVFFPTLTLSQRSEKFDPEDPTPASIFPRLFLVCCFLSTRDCFYIILGKGEHFFFFEGETSVISTSSSLRVDLSQASKSGDFLFSVLCILPDILKSFPRRSRSSFLQRCCRPKKTLEDPAKGCTAELLPPACK